MSENYKRQEVKSVSCSVLPIAAGGIILAAGLITTILSSLSSAAREICRINSANLPTSNTNFIKPMTRLDLKRNVLEDRKHVLSQAEAVKVSALLTISKSGYLIENTVQVQQKMHALRVAKTQAEVLNAQKTLFKKLEADHQRIFIRGLSLACAKASVRTGFSSIEIQTAAKGLVRVVASDSFGRALVTEINHGLSRETGIVTEVVGIKDGSCKKIIDTFDRALEEQGIRSLPPKRKFTGGVCETEAALEFIQRKISREQTTNSQTNNRNNYGGVRRIQTLNQRTYISQKA